MPNDLRFQIIGQGYDESITLSVLGNIVYGGDCDNLVTSQHGEIELRLNFSHQNYLFNYAMRSFGKYVVLVPTLHDASVSEFFAVRSLGTVAFPIEVAKDLWISLRYDPQELENLAPLEHLDCLLLWMLNSPSLPSTLSPYKIANWLEKNMVAEFPEEAPTICSILEDLLSGQMRFVGSMKRCQPNLKPVIAYLKEENENVMEWLALDSSDSHMTLLGNDWSIKVGYS